MAKRAKPKSGAKADVETYKHKEAKRKNIPTAENQKLIGDDDKAVKKLRWPRNPDLDPQLVWRGKDTEADPLEVDAPPIYIQEKIKPQAIIEDLRRQTKERSKDAAPQFDFFHDFNGLPEGWKEDATQSYYHDEGNWSNRMILGDSLLVMASLLHKDREALQGKIQCIYMDPPYGIKFNSNWQPSTKSREVKDTGIGNVSREPEVIRAFRDTWKDGVHTYLSYLRDRFVAAHDLLANTGSIFIQIGIENCHLVGALLDEVFGRSNRITQINFITANPQTGRYIEDNTDYLLWYAKDKNVTKFREPYLPKSELKGGAAAYRFIRTTDLHERTIIPEERANPSLLPEGSRIYRGDKLTSGHPPGSYGVVFRGRTWAPGRGFWSTNETGMERLKRADRLIGLGNTLSYIRFIDDFPAIPIGSQWTDTITAGFASDKRFVVQTNPRVIERCILMTTDPGDLVLDPTCGSGTTAYVAEQWGRRWITVDTSRVALTLTRARLMGAKFDYYLLKDSKEGATKEGDLAAKPPADGPFTNNIRHGFVYERVPHVMLQTVANNAEIDVIWEGWQKTLEPIRERLNKTLKQTWEEWQIPREANGTWPAEAKAVHAQWWDARCERQKKIDGSIASNAKVEYLYDRPYKARGVVRVTGPFTVESLSPHRVLPMGEDPYLEGILGAGEGDPSPLVGEGREGGREVTHPAVTAALHPSPSARRLTTPTPNPSPQGGGEKSGMVITDFAQVVYDNLKAAGVQNTKKGETLKFEWLKPFASRSGLIQFEGRYQEKGGSKRAAVCIGPEYDTVGYDLVRHAAREAADLFDTLIVCGFAFAPEVDDTRLNFGALTVLKARMNQDLRMADKLKATGAGNLFVVFGEPDIVIHKLKDEMLKVEIRGMDIFDPTTGEVRSSGGKDLLNDVAAWFIDNDYDEESFFVRQAYFVGDDPYDGLKRALKAEIDETAWAELNSTVSRPFPRPSQGRICVKVINHFGDEVQKVFQV